TPVVLTPPAPPQAPGGLAVKFVLLHELDLTWTDNSNNETGFVIQRRRSGSDWTTVGTAGPNTTAFADTQVGAYIHYLYRVRAVNAAGASAWSDTAAGDVGTGAIASLGWDARDFGSVALGSSSDPLSLSITNAGTGPLEIQSVSLGGADPGEF